ncbi:hypothetical protein [Bradyrhizobium sp. USDA 313]|uniref:hypothetical protein n=1 Tax=Bradyrhizobium sp. USDA 313 TaxID=3156307 RepID=UPI0035171E97
MTLTPRSGDHGRDVIAVRSGVGCIKIIGSVKAYKGMRFHMMTFVHCWAYSAESRMPLRES